MKGIDNNVTDTLSRIEATGKSVDHQSLAAAQENDNELREIINSGSCALHLKKVRFPDAMYFSRYMEFPIRGCVLRKNW